MKAKIIFFMILVVLFTIFVSQNTSVIPVNIYFWQVEMSVIVLMSLSVLIGVILGFILLKIFEHKEKKRIIEKKKEPGKSTPVH
jgi:uncharacterized integral membrane protein